MQVSIDTNPIFANLLKQSAPSVEIVCSYLCNQGWNAIVTADTKVVKGYKDEGDIDLQINEYRHGRVEVKQNRGFNWRSFEQWHTKNIFIDEYWHATAKPYPLPLCAYALVNKSKTGMFWVPVVMRPHWYKTRKYNSRIAKMQDYAAMDRHYLKDLYFDIEKNDLLPKHLVDLWENYQ
jgi:hypothetical protein